ncbi:MAG: hypothetical protein U0W24_13630 [Bacteroidales bacterium]
MKIKNLFLLVIIVCISGSLSAQNSTSSPYSMFGIGDISNNGFGRNLGMGGVSSSLISSFSLNPSNPATYSSLLQYAFLFEVGVSGNNYKLVTPNGTASKFDGNIRYIAMGFSVAKWWKAGFGLRPVTDIGYDIKQEFITEIDSNTMVNNYLGEGGINQFYFDNSFRIIKPLSIGLKVGYNFGYAKRTNSITTINEYSTNYLVAVNQKNFSAFNFGLGLHFHQSLSDNLFLNVGATYNFKTELSADFTRLITSTTAKNKTEFTDTLYNGTINEGLMDVPQSFSLGTSFILYQKLEIAADYQVEKWSEAKFFGEKQNFKDNNKLCIGVEYLPDVNAIKYLNAIRYRAGFTLANSYLVYNDIQLKQTGGSLGFGLPLRSGSLINVAFSYLKRYAPGDNDLSESYFQIHLNFSLQASWFYRPKFE